MDAVKHLSRAFIEAHPQDAARVLESRAAKEVGAVLAECAPAAAAQVLQRMVPPRAADCLSAMPEAAAATVLGALALETAAPILRRLPSARQRRVLESLPAESAEALRSLLRYPEGTAGALMDPRAFSLPEDITLSDAHKRVRKAGRRVKYYLYVVDRERRLVGVLNLRDFLLAPPDDSIASLMRRDVARLPATIPATEIVRNPSWRRYLSLPVVDEKGTFLGVLEQQVVRNAAHDVDRHAETPAWGALLAMGELYWAGLAGLVGGLSSPPRPDPSPGDTDAR